MYILKTYIVADWHKHCRTSLWTFIFHSPLTNFLIKFWFKKSRYSRTCWASTSFIVMQFLLNPCCTNKDNIFVNNTAWILSMDWYSRTLSNYQRWCWYVFARQRNVTVMMMLMKNHFPNIDYLNSKLSSKYFKRFALWLFSWVVVVIVLMLHMVWSSSIQYNVECWMKKKHLQQKHTVVYTAGGYCQCLALSLPLMMEMLMWAIGFVWVRVGKLKCSTLLLSL